VLALPPSCCLLWMGTYVAALAGGPLLMLSRCANKMTFSVMSVSSTAPLLL
jgi:hypothetical protein